MSRLRFAVNVFQATTAITIAGLAITSFFTSVLLNISWSSYNQVLLHFHEGRMRVFWLQSTSDPLQVTLMGDRPGLRIEAGYPWPPLPPFLVGADVPHRGWVRTIAIGGIRNVPPVGGGWRGPLGGRHPHRPPPAYSSFIRLPAWVPCIVLLYAPIGAVFRGVRERYRKRNFLCENCGYGLHALTEPRCPECGTPYLVAGA